MATSYRRASESIVRTMFAVVFLAAASRSVEAASITLAWDPNLETNIAGYILYYGAAPGSYTTTVDVGNTTTWTIDGLTDGQQYCFALRAYDTSGLQSPSSAEVCGIAKSAAQLTTPVPGSTLTGSTVQFQWSAGDRTTAYGLSIGTTPGGANLFNQNLGTSLSATVTGLPTNGSAVYVRLWSFADGVWAFTEYTYTTDPCSYILNPSSTSVGVAATIGTVSITTLTGCVWTATSNVPWITVTGGVNGAGNGMVSYLVDATTSTSTRTGAIAIAGQMFSVTQDALTSVIAPGAAAFVGLDRVKQGNWIGTFGVEGYGLVGDATSYPTYAQVSGSAASWTWSDATADERALQRASATGRVAATWYGTAFDIDVHLTDGQAHEVAVYSVDWDSGARVQQFDIVDAVTGAVLDTRTLSSFDGGAYLVWNVSGHVKIRVTLIGGVNAVVSGIFFGGGGAGASASFVRLDGTTQGNWIGAYGAQGYGLVGDATSYPTYAQVSGSAASWTWRDATADVRALQRASATGRVAATWYGTAFDIDVHLTDGQPHQVAVYSVDWDSGARAQQFDIVDAVTGAVLDTRTLSSFDGGAYLVWNVSGHVKIRVTLTGGVNAVVSGIFF